MGLEELLLSAFGGSRGEIDVGHEDIDWYFISAKENYGVEDIDKCVYVKCKIFLL